MCVVKSLSGFFLALCPVPSSHLSRQIPQPNRSSASCCIFPPRVTGCASIRIRYVTIIDTEYINERVITTTILVNRQHIKFMSVYFPHSKYADHHIEKMFKTIEKHMVHSNKYIPIIGGDFNAELGPGKGTERKSVVRYTLNESNKRGDWLKSWLMLNDYSALNTMFRKTPSSLQKGKKNKLTTF